MSKKQTIKAWAVYMPEIDIEWSDSNQCLAIYKNIKNARKRANEAPGIYKVIPVEISFTLPQ